jgi:hypothetical protein
VYGLNLCAATRGREGTRRQAEARAQALSHERDNLAEALEGAGVDPIALAPLHFEAKVAAADSAPLVAAGEARDARSAQLQALLDAAEQREKNSQDLLQRLQMLVGTQRQRSGGLSAMVTVA